MKIAMKPAATLLAVALVLCGSSLPATAASTSAERAAERAAELDRQLELTMVVSGDLDVDAEGRVQRYTLDHRDKLPQALVRMLDGRVPLWRFAPMALPEGQTHSALRMHLRVYANRAGEERDMFRMSVREAGFLLRDDPRPGTDRLRYDPRSRLDAFGAMPGIVYLALRIGPDGTVLQAFVERVDLAVKGSAKDMAEWRESLGRFTERQTRRLRFKVPATGPDAGLDEWKGRLPVAYNIPKPQDWEWQAYYRGPETRAPWKGAEDAENAVPTDLLPADSAETPEQARRLLTPLDVE